MLIMAGIGKLDIVNFGMARESRTRSVLWFLVKLFRNSKQKWHCAETTYVPSGQAWYNTSVNFVSYLKFSLSLSPV